MDRFIFVLGSNWKLSLAELDNVLAYSDFKGKIVDYSANIAVVNFEKLDKERYYINKLMELQFMLGGCQKIAKVVDFINIHTLQEAFPSVVEKFKLIERTRKEILDLISKGIEKIYPHIRNESLFYAVSIYPNFFDDDYYSEVLVKHFLPFLNKGIMRILKQKRAKKALYYKYPEEQINSGNLNPIFPHHLITYGLFERNRAEIIFGFTEEGVYIARTLTCDDPNFKKKIDEERPNKDFKSSISPKLSLIMLNFLNLFEDRRSKKVLDPFVGNGTILMFALLEDFQIYGADIDPIKVKNTIRNIQWLSKELDEPPPPLLNQIIKKVDISELSQQFQNEDFDGICTEPDIGPFFIKKPYFREIKELIDTTLEKRYKQIFKNAFYLLKSGSRIALIAPIFSTFDDGELQLNIEKIAQKYQFTLIPMLDVNRIVNKSNSRLQFQKSQVKNLIDAKKGQIVKRKLFIFEKGR
jgi:tRNA G10  N-methylase Trm11